MTAKTTTTKTTAAAKATRAPAKAKTTTKVTPKTATSKVSKAKATTTKAPAAKVAVGTTLVTKSGVRHPGALWLATMNDKGLSQMKCAVAMGVAPMTLNRLINGHGIPTAKVTIAFAKATESDVKKTWAQVADYELAAALEADSK